MEDIMKERVSVKISGNEYEVKELTLAQKNKLLVHAGGLIQSLAGHAFFRKNDSEVISFSFIDEVSLADLEIFVLCL